jgi:ribosomal protein L7Ae-like RNA K-turn-binding protein
MQSKLFEQIMKHLDLLENVYKISVKIFKSASNSEIDEVANQSENRERLINILESVQSQAETSINKISDFTDQDLMLVIRSWREDVNYWIDKIRNVDSNTTVLLEQLKEEATIEIANVYKNKENLRGYNLNNLRK